MRRQYAATFKRGLVERSLLPGASVSGIALDNGIKANALFRWRREHLRAQASIQRQGTEQGVLLPVKLQEPVAPPWPDLTPSCASVPASVIEIELDAARVRLRGPVDEANVRCVLQALRTLA